MYWRMRSSISGPHPRMPAAPPTTTIGISLDVAKGLKGIISLVEHLGPMLRALTLAHSVCPKDMSC